MQFAVGVPAPIDGKWSRARVSATNSFLPRRLECQLQLDTASGMSTSPHRWANIRRAGVSCGSAELPQSGLWRSSACGRVPVATRHSSAAALRPPGLGSPGRRTCASGCTMNPKALSHSSQAAPAKPAGEPGNLLGVPSPFQVCTSPAMAERSHIRPSCARTSKRWLMRST